MSDDIAARLQKVRQMHGYSQRELAKRAGVTNSSVSMIEQGRVSPSISSLEKLLKGIPMSLKDFFSFDPYSKEQCFYRQADLLKYDDKEITHHRLLCKNTAISYSIYQAKACTGDNMLIADTNIVGVVVEGELEVTINNQCETLKQGEGFAIESLSPYRFRNVSSEPTIVTSNHIILSDIGD